MKFRILLPLIVAALTVGACATQKDAVKPGSEAAEKLGPAAAKWSEVEQPKEFLEFFDGTFKKLAIKVEESGEVFTVEHTGERFVFTNGHDPEAEFVVPVRMENIERMVTLGTPNGFVQFMARFRGALRFNERVWDAIDDLVYDMGGLYMDEFSTDRFVIGNQVHGLLIHDEGDNNVPHGDAVKVQRAWAGSALMRTEGLGHSLQSDAVNARILDFLNEGEAESP